MTKLKLLAASLVATAAAAALPAAARTRVDIAIGLPLAPVVYQSAPVLYQPAPVVYESAPLAVEAGYWVPARWEWRGPSRIWVAGYWHGPRAYPHYAGYYRGAPAHYVHPGYHGYRH